MVKLYTKQDIIDFGIHLLQNSDFNDVVKTYDVFDEWDKGKKGKKLFFDPQPPLSELPGLNENKNDNVSISFSDTLIIYYYDGDEEGAGALVSTGHYCSNGKWYLDNRDGFIFGDRVYKWGYI